MNSTAAAIRSAAAWDFNTRSMPDGKLRRSRESVKRHLGGRDLSPIHNPCERMSKPFAKGLAVSMTKQISAVAIQTLKEALCSIYWYKADLRSFLQNCLSDKSLVGSANWDGYKRQVASDIVDALCANQEKYLGDIRRLFHEVGKMENFRHLEQLDDGSAK